MSNKEYDQLFDAYFSHECSREKGAEGHCVTCDRWEEAGETLYKCRTCRDEGKVDVWDTEHTEKTIDCKVCVFVRELQGMCAHND